MFKVTFGKEPKATSVDECEDKELHTVNDFTKYFLSTVAPSAL